MIVQQITIQTGNISKIIYRKYSTRPDLSENYFIIHGIKYFSLVSVTQCPGGRIGPDCQLSVHDNKETLDKEDDEGDNEQKCIGQECVTCDGQTGECLLRSKSN